jgi:hypothetical protein
MSLDFILVHLVEIVETKISLIIKTLATPDPSKLKGNTVKHNYKKDKS